MSEWISVKDRLPEEGKSVLIFDECGNILVYSLERDRDGDLHWEDDYGYWHNDVTDWMPLPEPPKED